MPAKEKNSDKRFNERLDLSLQICLPRQNGKTINVSASGVYFEVITNEIDVFAPGSTLPIQITAVTTTPGYGERKIKLNGQGCVVRNNIEDVTGRGSRLGVALEFKDKLKISPDEI